MNLENMYNNFYLEKPSLKRKEEAIDYIDEFINFNSNINGTSGLEHYVNSYEDWLLLLDDLSKEDTCPKKYVPSYEYFLIRKSDNKIIGMINLRLYLNEKLLERGGNIGYSIRPSERRKGYNKINLYLCLLKCQKYGLKRVLLTAYDWNTGSVKTILSLGGILENKVILKNESIGRYWINVDESINQNKYLMMPKI